VRGMESQTGRTLKRVRTDNGTEFVNRINSQFFDERGASHDKSAPGNPEQNGVAERSNRSLKAGVRSLLIGAGLSAEYWGEALPTAVLMRNLAPKRGKGITPYEAFTGRKPSIRHVRRWGCLAFVKLQKRGSFEPVSVAGMFIGYAKNSKAYRVAVGGKCVLVSPSVVFDESRNGIDVLRGRDAIPLGLRPQELGGLQPYPGYEEVVDLGNGDQYTLQWISSEEARPVELPEATGEFLDTEREHWPEQSSPPASEAVQDPVAGTPGAVVQRLQAGGWLRDTPNIGVPVVDAPEEQELFVPGEVLVEGPTDLGEAGKQSTEDVPPETSSRGRPRHRVHFHPQVRVRGVSGSPAELVDRVRELARNPIGQIARPLDREGDPGAGQPVDTPPTRRSRRPPDRYVPGAYACQAQRVVHGVKIPRSYQEAMSLPEAEQWQAACNEEIDSLNRSEAYGLEDDPPPDVTVLPCMWIFDVKLNEAGVIVRFKARLVAQGNHQIPGVDFGETFDPVCSQATRKTFFAVGAEEDWEIHQVDIKTAFLHGKLDKPVYMRQPPGFHSGGRNTVCLLQKSLYGLRQAPRQFHVELKGALEGYGFSPCESDPALFKREAPGESPTFIEVYVDDMLIASKDMASVQRTKELLKDRFTIHDLGAVRYFLGTHVVRDRVKKTISLVTPLKIEELLVRFGQSEANPAPTPMSTDFLQTKHPAGTEGRWGSGVLLEPGHRYPELMGSLQYLAGNTRPDIADAVGILSRYREAPTTSHWNGGMRVLRYLKGTKEVGITFGGTVHPLVGYVDSDYAGDLDNRRSTTGFVYLLNGGPVSWRSKKQESVASSTVEAEYMAYHAASKEARWLASLLRDLGRPTSQIPLYGDNQGCLANLKNPILSKYVKHIDVAFHSAREWVFKGLICPIYVKTQDNVADMFTKPLPGPVFARHRAFLGM
jgi:hypothetical protein